MKVTEKARALIAASTFTPVAWPDGRYYDMDSGATKPFKTLDKSILSASFAHVIDIASKNPKKTLGYSKEFGAPHLPKDFRPPKGLRFWLQIALDDLAPLDKDEVFPSAGMIWLFQHPETIDCAIHYSAKPDKLVVRDDIKVLDGGDEQSLAFASKLVFYVNDGDAFDYAKVAGLVPKALRESLEKLFDCKLGKSSGAPEVFGRPIQWQGEDEDYDGYAEDEDEDEEAPPPKKKTKKKATQSRTELLFNLEIDDASLHVWGDPAKTRKGNFDGVWETASTT